MWRTPPSLSPLWSKLQQLPLWLLSWWHQSPAPKSSMPVSTRYILAAFDAVRLITIFYSVWWRVRCIRRQRPRSSRAFRRRLFVHEQGEVLDICYHINNQLTCGFQTTVDIFVDQEKVNLFRVTFLMVLCNPIPLLSLTDKFRRSVWCLLSSALVANSMKPWALHGLSQPIPCT